MRRRATYAFGGHFIAPHKSMLFLSYLGVPGQSFWSSLGLLRVRVDVLMSWHLYLMLRRLRRYASVSYFICLCENGHLIFYAQAAYIRFSGVRFDILAFLFDAQAAQIRVGG